VAASVAASGKDSFAGHTERTEAKAAEPLRGAAWAVVDVGSPATRSMDYGKGWEGFTNDEVIEPCQGSECKGSEFQRVKVLDYKWQKPVTVGSSVSCHSLARAVPLVRVCRQRANVRVWSPPAALIPPTFPFPLAAQNYDMRARMARLIQQGSGQRLRLPESDDAHMDAVREAALSIYGDLRGPDGPSLEERVHWLADRIPPRVRQAAWTGFGAAVASVYWRYVTARAQSQHKQWKAQVAALDA
jgi:hypothetical protein